MGIFDIEFFVVVVLGKPVFRDSLIEHVSSETAEPSSKLFKMIFVL